jgi:CheY-like chemotaxis protein
MFDFQDVPFSPSKLHQGVAPDPWQRRGGLPLAAGINVLIIDDEHDTCEMVAEILIRAGYSVAIARNGQHALELLAVVRPELIFLDLQMPVLDGASFREQQRRNPELIQIPTVVVTGSREESQLDPAIAATLRKPVRAKDFLALVRRYCSRAS